ncbi:MAG: 2TM domain-containing protein [bacterium]|nr:2TM domain-containing protein [bacterium]
MEKRLDRKTTQVIQEEIRTRVFERYAEIQGIETEESELRATLDALHEITNLPKEEIERIASDVMQRRSASAAPVHMPQQELSERLTPPENFTFEKLRMSVKKKKRAFIPHIVSFCCINALLIFINVLSTSFPWAIFPFLGLSIGMSRNYFQAVRWPAADLRDKIQLIKGQVHQILNENIPQYKTAAQGKIFSGTYRMVVAESSQDSMEQYLKSVDPELPDNEIRQASTQLRAIREKYLA